MALAFRLSARLDIKAPHLIKTVRLEGVRKVGDPAEFARRYDDEAIDEILYLDAVASLYHRNHLAALILHTTERCFVPVTVAGGIRSVADARALIASGADKVAINTAALARPELITEIAEHFGSQAMVIQIDAKAKGKTYEAYCDGGREPSGQEVVAWAKEAVERGAGEILLTAIDREGTGTGFDLDLIAAVSQGVSVPVVAAGGFGEPHHAPQAAQAGAAGIAISGALHYNRVPLEDIREALRSAEVPVRPAPQAESHAVPL